MISAAAAQEMHRQHDLISGFGLFAIREDVPSRILDQACRVAAEGLGTRLAKVLLFQPDCGDFLVCSGVGWRAGTVGHARLDGTDSPAAIAFAAGIPVLSNDAVHDPRFRMPELLAEHGVRSALNVPIGLERKLGVLEVDATERAAFTDADTAFLRALAVTLTVALEKQERVAALARSEERVRTLLEASPDCVKVLSRDGLLRSINANGLQLLDRCDFAPLQDTPWTGLWPAEEVPKVEAALVAAAAGGTGRFEAYTLNADGEPSWWDVVVSPLRDAGDADELVAISRDVTDRVLAIRAKDDMLRDKDLLIVEIHHRVKNSLQLVQNLLALQARASGEEASRHLTESATRVRTISAIHDRLYKAGGSLDVQVDLYLEGLVDDLRTGLASAVEGRRILLEAAAVIWPAISMPTLGLVLTELVTNSLKYGMGDVRIRFVQDADGAASLVVEDDGLLPEDFDPQKGAGLGMRLVSGLLRGPASGLTLDRSRGTACFIARLPKHRAIT